MLEIAILSDAIKSLKTTGVDDFVDKAHYLATCALLIVFGLIVGAKQIFGSPISCMGPAEYTENWNNYVNSYCFVTSTFTVNGSAEKMPWDEITTLSTEQKVPVNYYQWVPYLLAVQAALFCAPHILWAIFQKTQTDIFFEHVVSECASGRRMAAEDKDKKLDNVVDGLVKTHEFRRLKNNWKGLGTAGLVVYILSKLLNALNVFVQLVILHQFYSNNKFSWGTEIINDAVDDAYWSSTGYFPRVSFCSFKTGVLANEQLRTVQCVLMMNMINEKILVLLFLWFAVLLIATLVNIVCTFVGCVSRRNDTAERYLKVYGGKGVDVKAFAARQLGYDGVLLLRFIEANAGFITASTVACKFYGALTGRDHATGELNNADEKGANTESMSKRALGKQTLVGGSLTYQEGNEKNKDNNKEEIPKSPFLNPDVSLA